MNWLATDMSEVEKEQLKELGERAFTHTLSPQMNARQAEALAGLTWEGRLVGTTLPDVEPPRVVVVLPMGKPESMDVPEGRVDRKTGEYEVDANNFVLEDPPFPPSHTLLVFARDGRSWQISRAGIVWPVPMPDPGQPHGA